MTWDEAAELRATAIADRLRYAGALRRIHELTGQVWRENLDRYDPSGHGDSPRLLGQMCAENFTNRAVAEREVWSTLGVAVSTPNSSLLLKFAGARLHLVKVPHAWGRQPVWPDFRWSSASVVRADAAAANFAAYPVTAPAFDETPLLTLEEVGFRPNASRIVEFFVVWAGEQTEDALTSGWLGAPTTAAGRWLAIAPLWHDDAGRSGIAEPGAGSPVGPEPELQLRLKRLPGRAER